MYLASVECEKKSNTFLVRPIQQFSGTSSGYTKPVEVGYFSLDGNRLYHDDSSQLRLYAPPTKKKISFNLRKGFDSYIEKDEDVKERLDHLLTWIGKHRELIVLKNEKSHNNRSGGTKIDREASCSDDNDNSASKNMLLYEKQFLSLSGWERYRLEMNLVHIQDLPKVDMDDAHCQVPEGDVPNDADLFFMKEGNIHLEEVPDQERLIPDFIVWRGHLTKFLITPYEKKDPWQMAVTKLNGVIYISEKETTKARKERLKRTSYQDKVFYWGFKFEDYMTKPMNEPIVKQSPSVVNSNEAYFSVLHTFLDEHSILFGAEVDCCVLSDELKPPDNYIELKSTIFNETDKQKDKFLCTKLLKYWAQSYLSGVPKVVVGSRTDQAVIKHIKEYDTCYLPYISEGKWDPNLCINFCSNLLTWLKTIVLLDNPNIVYMMTFDVPYDHIKVEIIDDGSERFLPQTYTDGFRNN